MTENRRAGNVYVNNQLAGIVWQDENGYGFEYDESYLNPKDATPVSLTSTTGSVHPG